jgi:CheY-like chemotaxis protein
MNAPKILAVDDEPDFEPLITQRFRKQIREGEFSFAFAGNGEEALAKLDADPNVDLILLDINMPVMDGLTMLGKLRERESAVRSIIVSAYGDMANLRTAMNRGAFDFVTKPVDLVDLETTIRKTLADVARRRDLERQRAAAERARHNLSRYFSPNIVRMLAEQDEPLGAVRRETVAVLFADIVGFPGGCPSAPEFTRSENGRCSSLQKLSLDSSLVDNRPDRCDLRAIELVENVFRKRDCTPVDAHAEELPLRRAFEGEADCNTRRVADQELDVEAKVWDVLEILHEHVSIAGQLERSAIMLDLVVNVASELSPILPVQTIDVGTVEIGKRRSGHGELSLDRQSASENVTERRDRRDRVGSRRRCSVEKVCFSPSATPKLSFRFRPICAHPGRSGNVGPFSEADIRSARAFDRPAWKADIRAANCEVCSC